MSLKQNLTLEGKGSADLVASLVELGGVKGETEAEGGAGVELGAVGKGGDTTVVDLDLQRVSLVSNEKYGRKMRVRTLAKETGSMRYLLATSRPTVLPVLEFQVALAPASTWLLTLW